MESRSHLSFRLQDFLSGLGRRRNGLHSSCLQLACVLASRVTEERQQDIHKEVLLVLLTLMLLLVDDAALGAQTPHLLHRVDSTSYSGR